MGGVRALDYKLTTQKVSPLQVELSVASLDRPELDPDALVPPIELSPSWWWEEFRDFLLEGIADICGSQEGGDPEGSTAVSALPEVCEE